jgi:predicted transcriptional regulator of viral defense system
MVDKLNRIKVEKRLKSAGLLVFTPREFQGFFGVPLKTAKEFISRNCKSGLFLKLRNSYYMVSDSNPHLFFVANKLYQPSYVSLERALSYYGTIPETIYTITSVTTKSTSEFITPISTFSYQKIKKRAFCGYDSVNIDGQTILMAQAEKALADYLYFVDLKRVSLNDRLYLKKINKNKVIAFLELFERPSLIKLIERIYVEQRKPRRIY